MTDNQPQQISQALLLPRGRLVLNPNNPRKLENDKIAGLAESIRTLRALGGGIDGTGILHALVVRWEDGAIDAAGDVDPAAKAIIQIGDSRYLATALAGFSATDPLPVYVSNQTGTLSFAQAVHENLYRGDLDPRDVGEAIYKIMVDEGETLERAAARLGGTRSWAQLQLDVFRADEDVQALIGIRPDSLTAVQRINRVKDPEFRRQLITAYIEGATVPDITHKIRLNKEAHREVSAPEQFGRPSSPSLPVLPRLDIDLALDSLTRQSTDLLSALRGVTLPNHQRTTHRQKATRLQAILEEVLEELAPQKRGRKS